MREGRASSVHGTVAPMSAGPSPGDERGPGVRELLLGNEQSEKHLEFGNRGM